MTRPPDDIEEHWMDTALSLIERDEPQADLAGRILARLRAEGVDLPKRRRRWRALAAGLAAAIVAAILVAAWSRSGDAPVAVVHTEREVDALPRSTRAVHADGLDGRALAALARLPGLRALTIASTEIPALGLGALLPLSMLEELCLRDVDLTDEHLASLPPNLLELRLEDFRGLSDAAIDAIVRRGRLRRLTLIGDSRISGRGYARLAELRGLTALDLSVPQALWASAETSRSVAAVDDEVLSELARLPLRELRLTYRLAITDAGVAALGGLRELEVLDLNACREVSAAGLTALPATLHTLALGGCPKVAEIPGHLRRLRRLTLSSNPSLDDADLAYIATLPELRHLDLRASSRITESGAEHLVRAERLEELFLCGSPWLDDGVLRRVAGLPHLEFLAVSGFGGTGNITAAGLAALRDAPALRALRIAELRPLPVAALRALAPLPLAFLDVSGTRIEFDAQTPDLASLRELWPDSSVYTAGMTPR